MKLRKEGLKLGEIIIRVNSLGYKFKRKQIIVMIASLAAKKRIEKRSLGIDGKKYSGSEISQIKEIYRKNDNDVNEALKELRALLPHLDLNKNKLLGIVWRNS